MKNIDTLLRFWKSEERRHGGQLLAAVMGLTVLNVLILLKFNKINGAIFNAFQSMNAHDFWRAFALYLAFLCVYVPSYVYQQYLQKLLSLRWRQWMTIDFLRLWFSNRSFYYSKFLKLSIDNPDQRIADDIHDFVDFSLTFSMTLFQQALTLIGFAIVLWQQSGALHITIGPSLVITVPGYMLFASVCYAILGSIIAHCIGRQLVPRNYHLQHTEADLRYGLAQVRQHAETIAATNGAKTETKRLESKILAVSDSMRKVMDKEKQLGYFVTFYQQFASFVPLLLVMPRFFARAITLGSVSQVTGAFGQVLDSLSFFINSYGNVSYYRSVITRLIQFSEMVGSCAALSPQNVEFQATSVDNTLIVQELTIHNPLHEVLIRELEVTIGPRDTVLIMGPSGVGKSTLLRTLTGMWPFATGRIEQPNVFKYMLLPQRPYLPAGTLRSVVCYPYDTDCASVSTVTQALSSSQIGHLAKHLDVERDWSSFLSTGEQQLLSISRVFVFKPQWLFLDEATSALDRECIGLIYDNFRSEIPELSIITVSHNPDMGQFHERTVMIDKHLDVQVRHYEEALTVDGSAEATIR